MNEKINAQSRILGYKIALGEKTTVCLFFSDKA